MPSRVVHAVCSAMAGRRVRGWRTSSTTERSRRGGDSRDLSPDKGSAAADALVTIPGLALMLPAKATVPVAGDKAGLA
jgi:hypothetical protein